VRARARASSPDHVKDLLLDVPLLHSFRGTTDDLETGDLVEFLEVTGERLHRPFVRERPLAQLVLEFREDLGLVVAKLGLDPVLGIEEYFAVRLPDTEPLHPRPLLLLFLELRVGVCVLQPQEYPVYVELHAVQGHLEA
jgi:hypothetical protein